MIRSTHISRSIRFIEYLNTRDWKIKVYGISQHGEYPSGSILERAKEIAQNVFPSPSKTSERYGVGFMIVHEADLFNQVVFDWWERQNELRHIVYKSSPGDKLKFENITPSGEAFCIWELKIISFERDEWVVNVLSGPSDFDAYLRQKLNTDE